MSEQEEGGSRGEAFDAPTSDSSETTNAIGPWRRLRSRRIYDNAWIGVREDAVLHPDGSPGIYGVVEFKNFAVGVVALDKDDQVCLVGQFRYPLKSYSWEIPEGGCSIAEGESHLFAAQRELREETGLSAGRWDYLGPMAISNSVSDETGHLWLARDLTQGESSPEPSESLQVRFESLDKAYTMAMEGEITDSISVIGLARAMHFLRKIGNIPV